jgi:hypothetical protein
MKKQTETPEVATAVATPVERKSLFHLTSTFTQLMEVAEENDGELTEEQLTSLAITRADLEKKVNGYASFIRHLEGQVELAKAEEKRIQTYKKQKERQVAVLKTALLDGLMKFGEVDSKGIYRIEIANEDGITKLSTRRSESVVISDVDLLPADFFRMPPIPEPEPDKKAIKEAIEAGQDIPGAFIQPSYSLSIK